MKITEMQKDDFLQANANKGAHVKFHGGITSLVAVTLLFIIAVTAMEMLPFSETPEPAAAIDSLATENTETATNTGETDRNAEESKKISENRNHSADKTGNKSRGNYMTARTQQETTPPPEECMITDVPYYSQKNVLPTGCEIVSAKMLLEYYTHEETDIEDMLQVLSWQYPKQKNGRLYAPHPADTFIGDPRESSGFGCFAPVIVNMLRHLLPEQYYPVDTSGTDLQELAETWLPQGTPVLVWATIEMWKPAPSLGWYLYTDRGYPTDKYYEWLVNEHCMVLIGYDETYYYFNDPFDGNGRIAFRKEITEERYAEIGSYSLVIQKDATNP